MKKNLFTAKMKLADALLVNHYLVLMLPRFGIELGFGDKSIEEICRQYAISPDFFLMICRVYSVDDYLPTKEEMSCKNMVGLVPYLIASHNYYLNERLPHIEKHLNKIAEACENKHNMILKRFFNDYKMEVKNHFFYEENTVFPYINNLLEGKTSEKYAIHQFEKSHSNIEEKLGDLTNILIKYLPHEILSQERISVLIDIFQLSSDLNTHSLIEEKILIPYVAFLEHRSI